jgi:hypothetical protein
MPTSWVSGWSLARNDVSLCSICCHFTSSGLSMRKPALSNTGPRTALVPENGMTFVSCFAGAMPHQDHVEMCELDDRVRGSIDTGRKS